MSNKTNTSADLHQDKVQLATFYVGDLCLALEIGQIQEIIRNVSVTPVPHAEPEVSGVINLRGEVTTIIDLRCALRLPPAENSSERQTLIVRSQGESIGLFVDRVGDITAVAQGEIVQSPPNVGSVDGQFFLGVCPRESEIIVVLDLDQALSSPSTQRNHAA
jgi:purine-binding chemotaxis protein CheW